MADPPLHLGIDVGTSSVKAVLLDGAGRSVARGAATHHLHTPGPGRAESRPRDWWAATRAAVGEATARGTGPIVSVGLSGQMHGLVLVDDAHRAVRRAILWPDQRATAELAAWHGLDPDARARLANPLVAGMTGPLLAWVRDHEPEVFERARRALLPKDWLAARLTGEVGTDPSDASATLLWDAPGDDWAGDVTRSVGLDPDLLPAVRASSTPVGQLTPDAATALDLPAGVAVVAGAADTAAALLGNGTIRVGAVQLTLGTGGQVTTPRDTVESRADRGVHLYRAALPGQWYAMGATLNVGLCLDWVRRVLGLSWAELYGSAATPVRPDDPVFLPHLVGERTPHLDADLRASWTGLGRDHDREAMARSSLEGVAFSLRDALDALGDAVVDEQVVVAGGGARSVEWLGLLADVLARPLAPVDVVDASGRGAALLGALGTDAISTDDVVDVLAPVPVRVDLPRPDRVAVHDERRSRFTELVAAVNG